MYVLRYNFLVRNMQHVHDMRVKYKWTLLELSGLVTSGQDLACYGFPTLNIYYQGLTHQVQMRVQAHLNRPGSLLEPGRNQVIGSLTESSDDLWHPCIPIGCFKFKGQNIVT